MSSGGARKGAGRKARFGSPKVTSAVRISTEAREMMTALCERYGLSHGDLAEYLIRKEYENAVNKPVSAGVNE